MNLKNFCFRLKLKLSNSNEKRNKLLRNILWHIGENSVICTDWFGNEPYLIWIGNDVIVASGVRFLNHDASCWGVYRNLGINMAQRHEKAGPIVLNDNCFIGANTMLLPNIVVGANSVVAAGSVVNKDIPDNEVWGGVPAKFIMTIDSYNKKILEYYENLPWKDLELTNDELKLERQRYFKSRIPQK